MLLVILWDFRIVRVGNLMTPVSVWGVCLVKMEFHQLEGMDAARRESEEQEMKYLQKLQAAERSRDEAHEVLLESYLSVSKKVERDEYVSVKKQCFSLNIFLSAYDVARQLSFD